MCNKLCKCSVNFSLQKQSSRLSSPRICVPSKVTLWSYKCVFKVILHQLGHRSGNWVVPGSNHAHAAVSQDIFHSRLGSPRCISAGPAEIHVTVTTGK